MDVFRFEVSCLEIKRQASHTYMSGRHEILGDPLLRGQYNLKRQLLPSYNSGVPCTDSLLLCQLPPSHCLLLMFFFSFLFVGKFENSELTVKTQTTEDIISRNFSLLAFKIISGLTITEMLLVVFIKDSVNPP